MVYNVCVLNKRARGYDEMGAYFDPGGNCIPRAESCDSGEALKQVCVATRASQRERERRGTIMSNHHQVMRVLVS